MCCADKAPNAWYCQETHKTGNTYNQPKRPAISTVEFLCHMTYSDQLCRFVVTRLIFGDTAFVRRSRACMGFRLHFILNVYAQFEHLQRRALYNTLEFVIDFIRCTARKLRSGNNTTLSQQAMSDTEGIAPRNTPDPTASPATWFRFGTNQRWRRRRRPGACCTCSTDHRSSGRGCEQANKHRTPRSLPWAGAPPPREAFSLPRFKGEQSKLLTVRHCCQNFVVFRLSTIF